ncbi:MAG: glycosyltransferase family 4 protein [Blastocatellia bacterium]
MKVVYLSPAAQLGGAEKVLLDCIHSLTNTSSDYVPHLVVAAAGPLGERAAALGAGVTVVPFPAALARLGDGAAGGPAGGGVGRLMLAWRMLVAVIAVIRYVMELRRTLITLAPDLIHTNGFKMHMLGLWARPAGTPVFWHIHDYVSLRPLMSRIMRLFAHRCRGLIAISASVAADLRQVFGEAVPVHTIYNGIDTSRYTPEGSRLDLDTLAGMSAPAPGTVRVALMATMARWKGHEVFLRALAQLPDSLPVRAYIIGGAIYQTDGSQDSITGLREVARGLGLADRVGFTGFIDDPAAAMRACDIIVHASTQPEPFGLVIVEAMACARAVVASNAGGAAEIIAPEVNALGHEPGNAEQLATALARLITDSPLRARLGAQGRETVTRRFDRARLGAAIWQVYANEPARMATIENTPDETLKKSAGKAG